MARSFELLNWSNVTAKASPQSELSDKSRKWLTMLARIKFQVEDAALEASRYQARDRKIPVNELFGERIQDFEAWATATNERSTRNRSVAEEEAWDFILRSDGLWIWRIVCNTLASDMSKTTNLGRQLSETAYQFDYADTQKLWEIFAALQIQLRLLDNFTLVYRAKYGQAHEQDVTHSWGYYLQERVSVAEKATEIQKDGPSRSPSQLLQDNLILQTFVGLVILSCIYPLVSAIQRSPSAAGSTSDADFWSQIISSVLGLAGFFTMLLPIYRETVAKEWIGTWILTVLGCTSAIIAIAIYPTASVSGAVFCSYLAASCQLLVLLQVSLIAGFKRNDRAKAD